MICMFDDENERGENKTYEQISSQGQEVIQHESTEDLKLSEIPQVNTGSCSKENKTGEYQSQESQSKSEEPEIGIFEANIPNENMPQNESSEPPAGQNSYMPEQENRANANQTSNFTEQPSQNYQSPFPPQFDQNQNTQPPQYGAQPPYWGAQPPQDNRPQMPQNPWQPNSTEQPTQNSPQQNNYVPYNHFNDYNKPQNGYNPYNPQNNPPTYNSGGAPSGSMPPAFAPTKMSVGFKVFIAGIAVLVFVSTISLIYLGINREPGIKRNNTESSGNAVINPDGPSLGIESNSKATDITGQDGVNQAQIAKNVKPSVVGVISYGSDISLGQSQDGQGSGIIMSADGYIITNAHVISNKENIFKVVTADEKEYSAVLLGMDPLTDLAVLKIDAKDLTAAKFGDSDKLEVGEMVMAIGNPGGLAFASSVTQGIVSALNRVVAETGMKFIQTDAAINPGNSGGALVNAKGYIIGINSSKIVAEGYEGIGFAIPINTAKPIVDDLIKYGKVQGRAVLGITGETLDAMRAAQYNMEPGVIIKSISNTSDLKNYDVKTNDIIIKMDDTDIASLEGLRNVLATKKPGNTVKVTFYRLGKGSFSYNVKLLEE